jgi:hypothetical protein
MLKKKDKTVVSGKPCATSLSEFHYLTLHSLQGLLGPTPCGAVTITQSPAIPYVTIYMNSFPKFIERNSNKFQKLNICVF